jgi:hypothetical protein
MIGAHAAHARLGGDGSSGAGGGAWGPGGRRWLCVAQRRERDHDVEAVTEGGDPSAGARIGGVGVGEHVFERLDLGSDGRGRVQGILQPPNRQIGGRW